MHADRNRIMNQINIIRRIGWTLTYITMSMAYVQDGSNSIASALVSL